MPAPAKIKNFASTLRDQLKAATDRIEKLSGDVKGSVDQLHARLDETEKLKGEIDSASAEIHQVVGMDNGGPN